MQADDLLTISWAGRGRSVRFRTQAQLTRSRRLCQTDAIRAPMPWLTAKVSTFCTCISSVRRFRKPTLMMIRPGAPDPPCLFRLHRFYTGGDMGTFAAKGFSALSIRQVS